MTPLPPARVKIAGWLSGWALERETRWSNKDTDPVPPHLRTWSSLVYVAYWVSDATNAGTWQLASSMLAVGLSWREAMSAVVLGNLIIAIVTVLNGTIGARLHISFPILNRSSFGYWFSYFSVIIRIVLSMFWFGVQTYIGSECVYQMLKAIWPPIAHLPNQFSATANITSAGLICYAVYWIFQFPFLLISPQRIRYFFMVKAIIVPATWLSIFIWYAINGRMFATLASQHSQVSGTKLPWFWLGAMNSAIGSYSTLAVNIADFTRYAKNERAQYIQIVIIPTVFTLASFIGLAVTSSGQSLYGETLWDPTHLIDRWTNRPVAFFASFSFAVATLGTNISANSLGAGNDLSVLAPRWVNIRRGQVICAVLGGWAICPWKILASATGFLAFTSGYSVFLGPFAGIMIADYWLVHKGRVDVPAMYNPRGRYRYHFGINWRAALALLISVPPNFPGLIASINHSIVVKRVEHIYDIAWLFGFFAAFVVYYTASMLVPADETFMDEAITVDFLHSD